MPPLLYWSVLLLCFLLLVVSLLLPSGIFFLSWKKAQKNYARFMSSVQQPNTTSEPYKTNWTSAKMNSDDSGST